MPISNKCNYISWYIVCFYICICQRFGIFTHLCSRYMGLPKTVITAAKASTRAASDTAPRNSVNLDADLDEDPEDIKVIHFGIVWYGYVSITGCLQSLCKAIYILQFRLYIYK